MNLEFRKLLADEIECRLQQVTPNGGVLLLYKDARCDMQLLDETVGAFMWKREHTRDNQNCIVSIYNREIGQWVSKEDTGTESNTEKEKGLASDSFKRACFNWGIGRELYTAPFIWVKWESNDEYNNGKPRTKFFVREIDYMGNRISKLVITDANGKERFNFKLKVTITKDSSSSKSTKSTKSKEDERYEKMEQDRKELHEKVIEFLTNNQGALTYYQMKYNRNDILDFTIEELDFIGYELNKNKRL